MLMILLLLKQELVMHLLNFIRPFVFVLMIVVFAYSQIDFGIFICTIVPAG